MAPDSEDGSIPDDAGLLRRIAPDPNQIIFDKNTGIWRPSSAAFRDHKMSVDVEPVLESNGLDWHFTLREHPGYSLVRFRAQSARQVGLAVVSRPVPNNPAHAEVIGKKSGSIPRHLRESSEWVYISFNPSGES
jgi:hypothetical protein